MYFEDIQQRKRASVNVPRDAFSSLRKQTVINMGKSRLKNRRTAGLAFVSDGKQRQKAVFFYSPDDNVSFHDVYDVVLEMNEGAPSSSIHSA